VAGGKAVVTGLDDPSGILDEIPGISDLRKTPPPPPVFDLAVCILCLVGIKKVMNIPTC
jgi:hypothetical protein